MSGFERSRFIDLSQSDCDEFTCGICLEILNNPIETKCCRKTYCKKCIITWINTNQLCPNDRRVLRVNDLINPSLIVVNLLSKLKIKCNGCQKIVSLGSLLEHMRQYHNNNYGSEMDENEWNREENDEQERQRPDHNYCFSIIKGIIKSFYNIIISILFFFLNIFVALVLFLFYCLLLVISNKTIQKMIGLLILIFVAFVFWTILKQSTAYIYLKVFDSREPYSLYKTIEFSNLRKTKYLELSYFVEHDFEEKFDEKEIKKLESEIESKPAAYEISGYSLQKSLIYPISRTSKSKFIYYVGEDFEKRFSSRKIAAMESQIEDYIIILKLKCLHETKDKEYLYLIEEAKRLTDKERNRMELRAKKTKLPSCVSLEKLSIY
jgi:hypothetical protein